jgi:hypothetical protein
MSDDNPERPGGLKPGERVRVTNGTFTGYEGRIMGPDEVSGLGLPTLSPTLGGEEDYWVTLSIFGRDVPARTGIPGGEAVMRAFFGVIGWSFIGSLVAGSLTYGAFLTFNYHQMVTPDSGEVQGWTVFAATMASAGFAMVGFVFGAIYGIIRVRRRPPSATLPDL